MSDFPWPVHEAAALFPLMEGKELEDLVADVRANGLREPVWVWKHPERGTVLLDGRNRCLACAAAGIDVTVPGNWRAYDGEDPVELVVSLNMRRRHLNPGQRAFLALEIEKLYAVEAAKRRSAGGNPELLPETDSNDLLADRPEGASNSKQWSRERAAGMTGTSGRSVQKAKRVQEQEPELAEKVRSGEIRLDRADRMIRDRSATPLQAQQDDGAGRTHSGVKSVSSSAEKQLAVLRRANGTLGGVAFGLDAIKAVHPGISKQDAAREAEALEESLKVLRRVKRLLEEFASG